MPGRDRTGPNGMGSMKGRGSGYCGPGRSLGIGGGTGRGFQRGAGSGGLGRGGRGRRRRSGAGDAVDWSEAISAPPTNQNMTKEQEIAMLEEQAAIYQQALDDLNKRIAEVQTSSAAMD